VRKYTDSLQEVLHTLTDFYSRLDGITFNRQGYVIDWLQSFNPHFDSSSRTGANVLRVTSWKRAIPVVLDSNGVILKI